MSSFEFIISKNKNVKKKHKIKKHYPVGSCAATIYSICIVCHFFWCVYYPFYLKMPVFIAVQNIITRPVKVIIPKEETKGNMCISNVGKTYLLVVQMLFKVTFARSSRIKGVMQISLHPYINNSDERTNIGKVSDIPREPVFRKCYEVSCPWLRNIQESVLEWTYET